MDLEIQGRVTEILDKVTGEGKTGNTWEKQDFVIRTQDQYPKDICFTLWGEKTSDLEKFGIGADIKVRFNIESREYNGKWYTNAKAWRIDPIEGIENQAHPEIPPQEMPDDFQDSSSNDQLPF